MNYEQQQLFFIFVFYRILLNIHLLENVVFNYKGLISITINLTKHKLKKLKSTKF